MMIQTLLASCCRVIYMQVTGRVFVTEHKQSCKAMTAVVVLAHLCMHFQPKGLHSRLSAGTDVSSEFHTGLPETSLHSSYLQSRGASWPDTATLHAASLCSCNRLATAILTVPFLLPVDLKLRAVL